jgi:hypothetical protein
MCDILGEIGWSTIITFSLTQFVNDNKKNSVSNLVTHNSSMGRPFLDASFLFPNPLWVGISPLWVGITTTNSRAVFQLLLK